MEGKITYIFLHFEVLKTWQLLCHSFNLWWLPMISVSVHLVLVRNISELHLGLDLPNLCLDQQSSCLDTNPVLTHIIHVLTHKTCVWTNKIPFWPTKIIPGSVKLISGPTKLLSEEASQATWRPRYGSYLYIHRACLIWDFGDWCTSLHWIYRACLIWDLGESCHSYISLWLGLYLILAS